MERREGRSVAVGNWSLTPVSGRVELRLPVLAAAWSFPLAIVADHADGRCSARPVVDVTRIVQGALLALGLLGGLLVARRCRRRRLDRHGTHHLDQE